MGGADKQIIVTGRLSPYDLDFPMKRLIISIAVLLGTAAAARAEPAPLNTLHAIHTLTNAEASQRISVNFEATVTYFPGYESLLFVQDGDEAVFVLDSSTQKLIPGDHVRIEGTTQASFHPIVISNHVTVLHHGAIPKPVAASFADLIQGKDDCMLVSLHAVVRTAELGWSTASRVTYLQMLMDGGYIDAMVDSDNASALSGLLDAEVEITGITGGKFDAKMQQAGILLHVPALANVKVLQRAKANPWSVPITPMDEILAGYRVLDLTPRIRVHGVLTYYQPGTAVVLQQGGKSLWIETPARGPLRIGDVADAIGFPDAHNGFLSLTHGEIQDSQQQSPIPPVSSTWQELALWSSNKAAGHLYDLVSIEGQVVTEVRGATQDEYVLSADGQLFSAIYRHPDEASRLPLPAMKYIPISSRIRVTGICLLQGTNPFNVTMEVPFNILIRDFDDITVVAKPSLVNTRNLILAIIALLLAVIAVGGWGWVLMKKVHRQTVVIAVRTEAEAAMERRRSSILIDINGSRPLTDIMEQIVEMVSFGLKGAPCWCIFTDGATFGVRPSNECALRILQMRIAGRSGATLGTLFAGLDPLLAAVESNSEALSSGVRLAALAIETRRLYSDLRRRSEYDLLTDIPNRFALEKRLNTMIEEARKHASSFGLIYIDLDKFKPINDRYGHHIGDLYLQEVALRMMRQLRGGDMLARLGGDEFAALVSVVSHRKDVEEYSLEGAASFGIALYPEDGATKDSLLSAADAAMYTAKNQKKQLEISVG